MARYSEELMPAPNYRGKHLPNLSGVENLIPGGKKTHKKSSRNLKATQPGLRFNTRTHPSSFPVCRRSGCCAVAAQWAANGRKGQESLYHVFHFCVSFQDFHVRDIENPQRAGKKPHMDPHRNAWTVGSGLSLCAFIWYQQSQRHLGTPDGAAILQLFSISYLLAVRLHTFLPRV